MMTETSAKCVYCESKVGHNCPGDVEHKIPVSHRPELLFEWSNMTIACTECNRRKSNYYDPACMFLDPNADDVESRLQHVGPLVFNVPGDKQAELTVKTLQLDSTARAHLIGRKIEKLEEIRQFVERTRAESNDVLKRFLVQAVSEHCSPHSEFSAMVKTYVDGLPAAWDVSGALSRSLPDCRCALG